jgi:uncharacterized membrane protein YgcG
MREEKVKSSRRIWFASLRRIAVTLAMVTLLFVSGTGLVGASSNTLPGDNLYPVKRTWEGLRLFFTFNPLEREALESEQENERLQEVQEVLAQGRFTEVDFNGVVTRQNGNEWVVANLRVLISDQTELRDQGIVVGSLVRVRGITQGNNSVLAERIRLLSSDENLPDVDDGHENNSGPGSGNEGSGIEVTEPAEPESDNSGSGTDSGTNDPSNDNSNENSNSNDTSGSNDISGSSDNTNDSSGGNDNGNDSSGDDSQSINDNGDDSWGGDNSGSGSDGGGGGDD